MIEQTMLHALLWVGIIGAIFSIIGIGIRLDKPSTPKLTDNEIAEIIAKSLWRNDGHMPHEEGENNPYLDYGEKVIEDLHKAGLKITEGK